MLNIYIHSNNIFIVPTSNDFHLIALRTLQRKIAEKFIARRLTLEIAIFRIGIN